MRRILLSLVLAAGCASSANAPRDLASPGGGDLSAVPDFAGLPDLSTPEDFSVAADLTRVYLNTTIHAIDTGTVPNGTLVAISGVVLTTPVSQRAGSSNCTFRAWVQDPTASAPAGLSVFTSANGACTTPGAPWSGLAPGDNVDVKGLLYVSSYAGDGGGTLTEHSIYVDVITKALGTATITPVQINDPTQFDAYASGFQTYEGMLVSLGCTTGSACTTDGMKLKVKYQPNPYLWGVTGGALFGSTFSSAWTGKPGANGTSYTRLVGVSNTFLTGSLEPRSDADFVP